jgi:negative regulator of flagellin synthesis FlgM
MKIDNTPFKPTTASVSQRPQPKATPESSATQAEAVSLSPLAGSLQTGDKPPVNSARIQEIKEAIAQGRFKINADAIAGRLVETARDMVSRQRSA